MAGNDQHSVRVRVWKIPKRHQPLVLVCPVVIKGTHIHQGLDLIAIVHSKEIAEGRVTGLLRVNCHYGVKAKISTVAKDRDSTNAEKLALLGVASNGEAADDGSNSRPDCHR